MRGFAGSAASRTLASLKASGNSISIGQLWVEPTKSAYQTAIDRRRRNNQTEGRQAESN